MSTWTEAGTKTCFRCGTMKPLSEFYRHPRMADGHINKCKGCASQDDRRSRDKRRAECAAYERKRNQEPRRKVAKYKASRLLRVRHPEKDRAWRAVMYALRTGALTRTPCVDCGDEKVQAHHDDYSRPLDVRWLCLACHCRVHGKRVVNQG